jgi:hypothetical protein
VNVNGGSGVPLVGVLPAITSVTERVRELVCQARPGTDAGPPAPHGLPGRPALGDLSHEEKTLAVSYGAGFPKWMPKPQIDKIGWHPDDMIDDAPEEQPEQ